MSRLRIPLTRSNEPGVVREESCIAVGESELHWQDALFERDSIHAIQSSTLEAIPIDPLVEVDPSNAGKLPL